MKDHYAVLGVMPTAEEVVIRAAYRALVLRYHPDHFKGPAAEAHARTTELNEAYRVLSDKHLRAEFDRQRGPGLEDGESFFDGDAGSAASAGEDPLQDAWELAVKFLPRLAAPDRRLAAYSWRLALVFRACLLESKDYENAEILAKKLEQEFFKSYFGTNPVVVGLAQRLFSVNERQAVRRLNEVVRVLGSGITSQTINEGLWKEHPTAMRLVRRQWLWEHLRGTSYPHFDTVLEYVRLAGGRPEIVETAWWKPTGYRVSWGGETLSFRNYGALKKWVYAVVVAEDEKLWGRPAGT